MANDLKSILKNVAPEDLHVDQFGRLVVNLPGLGQKIAEANPSIRRIPGAAASNNCDCGGGGGGGSGCGSTIQPTLDNIGSGLGGVKQR